MSYLSNVKDCLENLKLYESIYAHLPALMVTTLAYFSRGGWLIQKVILLIGLCMLGIVTRSK
jgi:hypothetical protein